jgi:RNA polymerase sigma-70 factor, ECF subfamily
MLRIACCIVRNRQDAEDCEQAALSKAWLKIGQFHASSEFSTWLTRIVVNECLTARRKASRGEQALSCAYHTLRAPEPDPEQKLYQSEIQVSINRCVASVPKTLRIALVSHDFEHMSIQRVAASLNISVPAAKSRLLRARADLRARMERKGTRNLGRHKTHAGA